MYQISINFNTHRTKFINKISHLTILKYPLPLFRSPDGSGSPQRSEDYKRTAGIAAINN